ncbi:2-isopropylmalate synthase, partial [Candidatus Micrarchaeota archaeon]|nr:2-isopropylmalate synthase [Candidatus Micrarchaeota archaeon]
VNGLGERTGNAPLEEVALDLKYLYKIKTVDIKKLSEISSFIENVTGITLPHNKPVVGRNAFTHESGIHVDGILKAPSTYEPINPEMVGQKRRIVLGKHSGSQAIKLKVKELGMDVSEEQLSTIFKRVKEIGDTGKEITDADFHAIVFDVLGMQKEAKVKLEEMVAITGSKVTPTASVKISVNNKEKISSATGNGPVDAAIKAIENSLGIKGVELVSYEVDAITGGTNALVTVKIRIRKDEKEVSAAATGTDIVMASVEAMLRGLNLLV